LQKWEFKRDILQLGKILRILKNLWGIKKKVLEEMYFSYSFSCFSGFALDFFWMIPLVLTSLVSNASSASFSARLIETGEIVAQFQPTMPNQKKSCPTKLNKILGPQMNISWRLLLYFSELIKKFVLIISVKITKIRLKK